MTRVKEGQRKRARTAKKRTGCQNCKGRHIRCDETRPSCTNCASTSRVCGGYSATPPPDPKAKWQITTYIPPVSAPMSTAALIDQTEARSFEFFHVKSLIDFSSVFKDEFWTELVPQLASTEPAIRHALCALSSYHEGSHETFALNHYNRSIRELTQPQPGRSKVPLEVQMVSCIIFFSIEALRRRPGPAIALYDHGSRVLAEILYSFASKTGSQSQMSQELLPILLAVFVRLDLQINQMIAHTSHLRSFVREMLPSFGTKPVTFTSFFEARAAIELLAFAYTQGPDPTPEATGERLVKVTLGLRAWSDAFETFLQTRQTPSTPHDMRSIAQLRMLKLYLEIDLHCYAPHNYTGLVPYVPEITLTDLHAMFTELVDYAAIVVSQPQVPGDSASNIYSPDIAVIPLLFVAARNCPDPTTQAKALHLLKTSGRVEGIWDGALAGMVCDRLLALAEVADSMPKYGLHDSKTSKFVRDLGLRATMRIAVAPHHEKSSIVIQYGEGEDALRETLVLKASE